MLSCKEAIELASQSQDTQLPWQAKIGFRVHLLMCKTCARYVEQLAFIKKSVSQLDERIQNSEYLKLSADAKARIHDVIFNKHKP